jgi:hypothetical protein
MRIVVTLFNFSVSLRLRGQPGLQGVRGKECLPVRQLLSEVWKIVNKGTV